MPLPSPENSSVNNANQANSLTATMASTAASSQAGGSAGRTARKMLPKNTMTLGLPNCRSKARTNPCQPLRVGAVPTSGNGAPAWRHSSKSMNCLFIFGKTALSCVHITAALQNVNRTCRPADQEAPYSSSSALSVTALTPAEATSAVVPTTVAPTLTVVATTVTAASATVTTAQPPQVSSGSRHTTRRKIRNRGKCFMEESCSIKSRKAKSPTFWSWAFCRNRGGQGRNRTTDTRIFNSKN